MLCAAILSRASRIRPTIHCSFAKSHAEHDAIVSAILQGDAETASEVMRTHVNIVRAASRDYVHELGLLASVGATDDVRGKHALGAPTRV